MLHDLTTKGRAAMWHMRARKHMRVRKRCRNRTLLTNVAVSTILFILPLKLNLIMYQPTFSSELADLKGISFGSLNVCSLKNKVDDINVLLLRSDLDLLAITESWLDASLDSSILKIDGYNCFRFDRDAGSGKRGGGGLVAYVKDKYNFSYLENLSLCTPDGEYMWIKLELKLTRPTYLLLL